MATQIGTFDCNNPRYKCCCSKCHSTTGVKVVAFLQLVVSACELLGVLRGGAGGIDGRGFGIVINLACVGCAFYAIHSGTAGFLLPYMILSAIGVVGGVFLGLTFTVAAIFVDPWELQKVFWNFFHGYENRVGQDTYYDRGGVLNRMLFAVGLILLICSALEVWIFLVFLAAYRFLREKALAGYTGGQQMVAMWTGRAYPAAQHYAPRGYVAPPPAYGWAEAPPGYGQPQAQPIGQPIHDKQEMTQSG